MEAYDIVNPRSFDTRAISLRARIFVTKGNPKQQPTNDRRPVLRIVAQSQALRGQMLQDRSDRKEATCPPLDFGGP
jgi:hypothetical protein